MQFGQNFETIELPVTVVKYRTPDGRLWDKTSEAVDHNIWLDRKQYLTQMLYEEMMSLNVNGKLFPYISRSFKTVDDIKAYIWVRLSKDEKSEMGYVNEHDTSVEFDEDMPFDYQLWDELKYAMLKKYGYTLMVPYYYWGK